MKPEKLERVNKRIQKTEDVPPPNAIPYGQHRRAHDELHADGDLRGAGRVAMGEGNSFGLRYAWYVAAMRNRISANWLMSTVSPNIASAPAHLSDVRNLARWHRNQCADHASSGIPEVDRSALRAILASNPLPPLPPDYCGSSVNVEFYFDFHRQ